MTPARRDIPGILIPPPLLYGVPLVLGLLLDRLRPLPLLPRGAGHLLGAIFLGVGLMGYTALAAFRRAGTSPNPWRPATSLVIAGPYRFTRNPMYLGFTLLYLGASFWFDSIWPLLALPIILVVMQRGVISREERYLEERFGDEYRQYRARVRRWL